MANELFNQYGPSNQINQIRESLQTQGQRLNAQNGCGVQNVPTVF